MDIFDAHTRFFGREFYEFHTARRPNGSTEILLNQTADAGADVPSKEPNGRVDRILADMDACGISRAVTYSFWSQEAETVGEAALGSNGRLIPYAVVNPEYSESLDVVRKLQPRYGFRGVVLLPMSLIYPIDGERTAETLDFARAHDMVVLVQFGSLRPGLRTLVGVDSPNPPEDINATDLIRAARSRPDQRFVVPCGGAGYFVDFQKLGESCPNIYADTAGSTRWAAAPDNPDSLAELFDETRKAFGVERMLYGSGSAGFPREYRTDIRDVQISAMTAAGFTENDRAAVLGLNLSALLGLTR